MTIDTLRADHTSVAGYPVRTTPFLEDMAARGVTFDQAYSHSSTTAPSHASIFTGLLPIQHRVQTNGVRLPKDFTTVAEELRTAGWQTRGVVSVPSLFLGARLAAGFEDFDPRDTVAPDDSYRKATDTIDVAVDWLANGRREGDPFFLWVHLYDPHRSMDAPDEHVEAVTPIDATEEKRRMRALRYQNVRLRKRGLHEKTLAYDAEIHYADAELRRLYDFARQSDAARDTLWVFTADHGQGLNTHGWFGHHVQIYNEQLHVPLIFVFPNDWQAGRRVSDHFATHVDLTPTLLEILGLDAVQQPAPITGVSLAPLFEDDPVWNRTTVFSERRMVLRPSELKTNEGGVRQSLQTRTRKYLLFSGGPDEYYHLDVDPYEQNNVIDRADAEALRLRDLLVDLATSLTGTASAEEVSEEDLARLRALGYVQ